MNIVNEIINNKPVNLDSLDMKFFIVKHVKHNGRDHFQFQCGDPQFVIPLMFLCDSSEYSKNACRKLLDSDIYHEITKRRKEAAATLNTRGDSYAESLEALQNKLDKGREGWKHGDAHVIDISKLEVYDMTDPDIVKKTCGE